jgi:hypothetical protein
MIGMREDVFSSWKAVGRTWSSNVSPRTLAVQAALYGTYEKDKELPGLETLEEEGPEVNANLKRIQTCQ